MKLLSAYWNELKEWLREFIEFRFRLSADLLAVLVSFLALVAGIYLAWKTASIGGAWVPVSMLILGVAVPIAYSCLVKKLPLSETGIRGENWLKSMALGLILAIVFFLSPMTSLVPLVTSLSFAELLPLLALELTAGLFWAVFFHGWVQMRCERAFGAVPAIFIAATFFALHHVGYGEPLSLSHMFQPFIGGIIFSTAFRITRNLLVLWPFFIPVNGLFADLAQWNLRLPFESTYWYASALALMLLFIAIVRWKQMNEEKV